MLSGEIDADLGADLQEATAAAEDSGLPVEIDAHHVTFMDSSGVAFLARLASRGPHRVRVLRAPPTVRFLLEVTRIGELLDIVDVDPGFDLDEPRQRRGQHRLTGGRARPRPQRRRPRSSRTGAFVRRGPGAGAGPCGVSGSCCPPSAAAATPR